MYTLNQQKHYEYLATLRSPIGLAQLWATRLGRVRETTPIAPPTTDESRYRLGSIPRSDRL